MKTQLPFEEIDNQWGLLPSPKIRYGDRDGIYGWEPFYSAFSERFALFALQILNSGNKNRQVLDPFVGGGTTLVAAAKLGMPAIGIDLDPLSSLLSRARVAVHANADRVQQLLADPSGTQVGEFGDATCKLFRASDLRFATAVFSKLQKEMKSQGSELWNSLLDDPSGEYDSEAVALTAVCLAAGKAGKIVRGSNPVWYRPSLPGEVNGAPKLGTVARQVSKRMLNDLKLLERDIGSPSIRVINEDARILCIPDGFADIILTSPPYLNRMDYVVSHLGPLSLLTGLIPLDLESIRRRMVGTTKIVGKEGSPHESWGTTCVSVLKKIEKHPSKASATYYYWNYYRYFADLACIIGNLKRIARKGAVGGVVIQNSFYKDLLIPTPTIFQEMAVNAGIETSIARTEKVRAHLGKLSPVQVSYVPRKVLEESVIVLSF